MLPTSGAPPGRIVARARREHLRLCAEGYRARLAEIERKYPRSLADRRGAIARTAGPFLGAGTLGFATLGVWLDALDSLIDMKKTK